MGVYLLFRSLFRGLCVSVCRKQRSSDDLRLNVYSGSRCDIISKRNGVLRLEYEYRTPVELEIFIGHRLRLYFLTTAFKVGDLAACRSREEHKRSHVAAARTGKICALCSFFQGFVINGILELYGNGICDWTVFVCLSLTISDFDINVNTKFVRILVI